jgi:hypothetical protein
VRVGGDADVAVLRGEQPQQERLREGRVLVVVDDEVAPAAPDAGAHVGAVAQQPEGEQDEVAAVERARAGQQAVVGRVEGGELGLPRSRPVLDGGGPGGVVLRGDELVLEPVDPLDHRAQQRGRVAAEVVARERQLVDVLEQHRQAVGRAHGHGERVDAGLVGLVAQQERAEALERRDRRLLGLDRRTQAVGGRGRMRQGEDGVRGGAGREEVADPRGERRRLPGPRPAEDQRRPRGGGGWEHGGHTSSVGPLRPMLTPAVRSRPPLPALPVPALARSLTGGDAMEAGAVGYLRRDADIAETLLAVVAVTRVR